MRFPHRLNPETPTMSDDFSETQANVLIGTTEKMIDIWNRLFWYAHPDPFWR